MTTIGLSAENGTQTEVWNPKGPAIFEARFPDDSQFVVRERNKPTFDIRFFHTNYDTRSAVRSFLQEELGDFHGQELMDAFQILSDIAKKSRGIDEWIQNAVEEFPTQLANLEAPVYRF